jgi:hypothetical protein
MTVQCPIRVLSGVLPKPKKAPALMTFANHTPHGFPKVMAPRSTPMHHDKNMRSPKIAEDGVRVCVIAIPFKQQ